MFYVLNLCKYVVMRTSVFTVGPWALKATQVLLRCQNWMKAFCKGALLPIQASFSFITLWCCSEYGLRGKKCQYLWTQIFNDGNLGQLHWNSCFPQIFIGLMEEVSTFTCFTRWRKLFQWSIKCVLQGGRGKAKGLELRALKKTLKNMKNMR